MLVKQGTTGKTVGIFVRRSDGTAYTGLAYNASGFKCYYVREGGSVTAVTLDGTNWTESDATNMPGRYKFIVPDAALASSANYVEFEFFGAADMLPVPLRVELVAFDPFTDFTTQVTGIKTKTDQLTFTMANMVDTTVYGIYTSVVYTIADGVWGAELNDHGPAGDAVYDIVTNGASINSILPGAQTTIKSLVDSSLNTAIPETPVAGSINAQIKKLTFDGSNNVNAGMQAIGAGVVGTIQNSIWSADASEWSGVGAGGTLYETWELVNGIINTYDGSGYIQAVVMDIAPDPRAAIAGEILSADVEPYGMGYPGTVGYNLYHMFDSNEALAEVSSLCSGINAKTSQLNFTGTYVNAQAKGLDANVITAASIASNAITSAKIASNALITQGVSHVINTSGLIDDILSGSMGVYSRGTLAGELQAIADKTDHLTFDANDWVQAYTNGGSIETFDGEVDLTPAARQAIWDWSTAFITAAGSIGKVIKDNLNATISSRAVAGAAMTLATDTITAVADKVWITDGRALTSAVDVSSDDITEIRSGLVTLDDISNVATYSQSTEILEKVAAIQVSTSEQPINLVHYTYRMIASSGTPIEGVTIRLTRDRAGTEEVAPDQDTDSLGETSWILTPGTYYVTRTKIGQTYANPDIWRITG